MREGVNSQMSDLTDFNQLICKFFIFNLFGSADLSKEESVDSI